MSQKEEARMTEVTGVTRTVTFICVHDEHRPHPCEREFEATGTVVEWFEQAQEAGWFPLFRLEAWCPEHFQTHVPDRVP
jgi:hypothetical protein